MHPLRAKKYTNCAFIGQFVVLLVVGLLELAQGNISRTQTFLDSGVLSSGLPGTCIVQRASYLLLLISATQCCCSSHRRGSCPFKHRLNWAPRIGGMDLSIDVLLVNRSFLECRKGWCHCSSQSTRTWVRTDIMFASANHSSPFCFESNQGISKQWGEPMRGFQLINWLQSMILNDKVPLSIRECCIMSLNHSRPFCFGSNQVFLKQWGKQKKGFQLINWLQSTTEQDPVPFFKMYRAQVYWLHQILYGSHSMCSIGSTFHLIESNISYNTVHKGSSCDCVRQSSSIRCYNRNHPCVDLQLYCHEPPSIMIFFPLLPGPTIFRNGNLKPDCCSILNLCIVSKCPVLNCIERLELRQKVLLSFISKTTRTISFGILRKLLRRNSQRDTNSYLVKQFTDPSKTLFRTRIYRSTASFDSIAELWWLLLLQALDQIGSVVCGSEHFEKRSFSDFLQSSYQDMSGEIQIGMPMSIGVVLHAISPAFCQLDHICVDEKNDYANISSSLITAWICLLQTYHHSQLFAMYSPQDLRNIESTRQIDLISHFAVAQIGKPSSIGVVLHDISSDWICLVQFWQYTEWAKSGNLSFYYSDRRWFSHVDQRSIKSAMQDHLQKHLDGINIWQYTLNWKFLRTCLMKLHQLEDSLHTLLRRQIYHHDHGIYALREEREEQRDASCSGELDLRMKQIRGSGNNETGQERPSSDCNQ